jgi:hypothetical protein
MAQNGRLFPDANWIGVHGRLADPKPSDATGRYGSLN